MNWKEVIMSTIQSAVSSIEGELAEAKKATEDQRASYLAVLAQYTNVQKQLADHQAQMIREVAEIDKERKFVESERQSVEDSSRRFNAEASRIQEELIQKRDTIAAMDKEIVARKGELKSVATLGAQKSLLLSEISKLESDIESRLKTLQDAELRLTGASQRLAEVERTAETKFGETLANLDKQMAAIRVAEGNLKQRELKVSEKEEALKTIESRYQKLYNEKGLRFKL